MGMSRCYSLMKCLLVLFNIIFLCVGSAALAFAGWALWEGGAGEAAEARAGLLSLAGWAAALALGAAAALAGCARGSAALLAASFALLALSAVAEAAAAWWGAAHLPQLRRALLARLDHSLRHDYGRLPARTHALDAIQRGLECCGAESIRDWEDSAWSRALEAAGAGAGAAGPGEEPLAAARGALDLSVSAAGAHYWVPASCCAAPCAGPVRVVSGAGAGAAGGAWRAACGPRVVAALAAAARAPLCAGGALLAAHALSLLLALALCLRADPHRRYKA
ncbi:tetraspanin-1-like [Achroia grisella]|uniref:tetraspanin-1-like n=1 Tax=Achroia grisella TaxID=688607 RepID=UPI0027D30514|nr:tetraspanin-1-like [Achroia grisella]